MKKFLLSWLFVIVGIVLFGCGFWAFSLGMVTNGFIGDLLPKYLNINIPTVIASFDAFGFPQHILIMALLTGFIYLNLGFLLGAYNNFVYGNKKEARIIPCKTHGDLSGLRPGGRSGLYVPAGASERQRSGTDLDHHQQPAVPGYHRRGR